MSVTAVLSGEVRLGVPHLFAYQRRPYLGTAARRTLFSKIRDEVRIAYELVVVGRQKRFYDFNVWSEAPAY